MRLDEAARRYLGVPWKHQGRDRVRGLDCIGLCVVCAQDLGWTVRDQSGYPRDPHGNVLEGALREHFARVPDMRPGDVVSIRFAGPVRHVAIVGEYMYGGLSLIHSNSRVGKVVEHRLDDHWRNQIVNVYRRPAE